MNAASLDEFDQPMGSGTLAVRLIVLPVFSHTPKGVWLGYKRERFVLNDSAKKYACHTIDEARRSFIACKEKMIHILRKKIDRAERCIAALDDKPLLNTVKMEIMDLSR